MLNYLLTTSIDHVNQQLISHAFMLLDTRFFLEKRFWQIHVQFYQQYAGQKIRWRVYIKFPFHLYPAKLAPLVASYYSLGLIRFLIFPFRNCNKFSYRSTQQDLIQHKCVATFLMQKFGDLKDKTLKVKRRKILVLHRFPVGLRYRSWCV